MVELAIFGVGRFTVGLRFGVGPRFFGNCSWAVGSTVGV